MNGFIVGLTRNIGIGNDIVNYFEKRGYKVVYCKPHILPRTLIVETENDIEDFKNLQYVDNVITTSTGNLSDVNVPLISKEFTRDTSGKPKST